VTALTGSDATVFLEEEKSSDTEVNHGSERVGFLAVEQGLIRSGLADRDGDGIPDWWEEDHFGGPTNAVSGADSDGDGFDNYSEWTADTNPTNPASFFMLGGISKTGAVDIQFDSSSNRIYRLQFLNSLQSTTWSNLLGQQRRGVGGMDSFTDTNDVPRRNYRIQVELP